MADLTTTTTAPPMPYGEASLSAVKDSGDILSANCTMSTSHLD